MVVAISFATYSWANVNTNVTINHVSGTTTVPTYPKKVIVFDFAALDNMNRLGVKVIAVFPKEKNLPIYSNLMMQNMKKLVHYSSLIMRRLLPLNPISFYFLPYSSQQGIIQNTPTIGLTLENQNSLEYIKRNASILRKFFGKGKETKQKL